MAPKKDAKNAPKPGAAKKAGAGAKKKKWSKGKVREKLNNLVVFDQATYDRMLAEVKNFKLVTPSAISERLKVCSASTQSFAHYRLNYHVAGQRLPSTPRHPKAPRSWPHPPNRDPRPS